MIRRSEIHWITEAGMFFEKKGPVWETLRRLADRLEEAGIDYVVIGGLALNAYNYPRQTIDVDVVLRPEDYQTFKQHFEASVYERAEEAPRRFVDRESEVTIDVLIAGELAGRRSKNPSIRFPDPSEAEEHAGLRTVSLARLIELKLVTWRFKDWGDVVELIRRNALPESFGSKLERVVRKAFGECFDQARDEEYEPPGDD
ncbi:MAG: hypothetical protein JSV78_05190 [Phycisphaerales bacterium]|nr:MAG: hypothetical protein JSV78_05190 [Phycisphaerales bacterium]